MSVTHLQEKKMDKSNNLYMISITVPPVRRVHGCSPQSLSPLSEGEDVLVIPASETRHRLVSGCGDASRQPVIG